ncbi:hypothetical protein K5D65_13890 [Pseudomonas cichorii]|nr:hypothetical protein [Pseudomonas cichorii]
MSMKFIVSMVVMVLGLFSAGYVINLYIAGERDKDCSHYLLSSWHRLVLGGFNLPGAKFLIVTISMCAIFILLRLIWELYDGLMLYRSLNFITRQNYLSAWMVLLFAAMGWVVNVAIGDKGMVLPIGSGLALSVDKKSLAFHLLEDKPSIKNIARILPSVVKRLREKGINNPLVFQSWLLVARPDSENENVKLVHMFTKRVRSLMLNQLVSSPVWKIGVFRKFFTLTVSAFTAVFFGLFFWRPINSCLKGLPPAELRKRTKLLIKLLQEKVGDKVEELSPKPVAPAMLISLCIKYPRAVVNFGGMHGGFILTEQCVGADLKQTS